MIPDVTDLSDITSFDDLCLWMYCIVDDLWKRVAPRFARPGPPPRCSDSELIAMCLLGECKGWGVETELLSQWREYSHLFPHLPSQSRFNRRRRALAQGFNFIRRLVLSMLDMAQERKCVIDSLPVPVVQFHLAPRATREWAVSGARYGMVSSKQEPIYGYKLHMLVTLGGVILDYELVASNAADGQVGWELLGQHTHLMVLADKAYVSDPITEDLWTYNRVQLLALRRVNQKKQWPVQLREAIEKGRQIIETVNGQLAGQFGIEINHAHTLEGMCTRLHSKLTAHTMCLHINRLLGKADFLHIKQLAFPS